MDEIMEGLHLVRRSPRGVGTLALAVRRPAVDAREVLSLAELDPDAGLIGDSWSQRPSSRTTDLSPHPDMQLNVINSRFIELIAGPDRDAWALAGDQLYVDLDLSVGAMYYSRLFPVCGRVAAHCDGLFAGRGYVALPPFGCGWLPGSVAVRSRVL